MRGESLFRLVAADASVKKKPNPTGFDVNAVTAASRLQCDHFHGGSVPNGCPLEGPSQEVFESLFPFANPWTGLAIGGASSARHTFPTDSKANPRMLRLEADVI